jgi:exonuclease III
MSSDGFRGYDRAKNRGWRIDYFVVSSELIQKDGFIYDCTIDSSPTLSDHNPIVLMLDRADSFKFQ